MGYVKILISFEIDDQSFRILGFRFAFLHDDVFALGVDGHVGAVGRSASREAEWVEGDNPRSPAIPGTTFQSLSRSRR